MFWSLTKFEFNYFRKQPSFYVTSLIFFLMPFFAMISDNVQIGGASNVNFNSPHAITQTILIMSLIGMFLVANFVGGTAIRDTHYKMDGIMLTTPISKGAYLWGRLLGALGFCLLVFAFVPLGTLIGSFWPTVDAERLGATTLLPYFWAYLIFVIPNFLFCSALFYVFALKTRSMMGMYLGVIGFFILYEISSGLLDDPSMVTYAALLDPFGFSAFSDLVNYWTPNERNTQLVPLQDNLLINRVLWVAVSLVIIVLAHVAMDVRKPKAQGKQKAGKGAKVAPPANFVLHKPATTGGHWARFTARCGFEITQILKSPPFIILCLFSMFMLVGLLFNSDGLFGTSNWPLTRSMADYIQGTFMLMMFIVVTYYSAEIVWKERELGIGDIIDSTPTRNWSLYFPKLIALVAIVICLTLVGVLFTVSWQLFKGYTEIEWGLYASLLALTLIIPMAMNAVLAFMLQVLSPNKYIGMLIFVLYIIASLVLANLGLEHRLWHFARTPSLIYSDINGYGHFLSGALWYNLYWSGLSLILVVAGYGLWRRGAEYSLRYRLTMLPRNMGGAGAMAMVLGLCLFIGAGSYVFYNTRVVNSFYTEDQNYERQEAYERQYKQFQYAPVPTITDVYAEVDIYPDERRVQVQGHYLLRNETDKPLEKTLVFWEGGKHREMSFTTPAGQETDRDERFYSSWLTFEPALQPGDTTRLDFNFSRANQGFVDRGSDTRVVANGTFVNNGEIFPHFGYNSSWEIFDRHERRKRDLPPPERLPKLEDSSQYGTNFISAEADFINFETIVSTVDGQVALAPGYLQKTWQEQGRSYFHYKMDAPIFNFVAFLSGDYAIEKDVHKGINIEVYHHPQHDKNVQRMIDAVKASLDYFGAAFSPYQHRQVRIIEFPRYAGFAQSFSNTIPYSEDIGFIADLRDEEAIDYVSFVTAHEMAHQWWGHQVTPANVQGGAVLSETLSEYSAYLVMEKMLGKRHLRKFLKWEMDRYLRGRSGEVIEEMPLYRAENQQYIHYQKGGVVMYALRDRYGEEAVNRALRNFLQAFQYASDPYPTTLDLLQYLKAEIPEHGHGFVDDMFKKITLFDLKVEDAVAIKLPSGNYQLELTIKADKYYADGMGEETLVDFTEQFDIGVFAKDPDAPELQDKDILYFDKHRLSSGETKLTLEVSELPQYVGVDPYITMIDRDSDDNLKAVTLN
jgi:ABC-2 type transport system permease protein